MKSLQKIVYKLVGSFAVWIGLFAGCSDAAETNLIRNAGFEDTEVRVAWTNFSTASIGKTPQAFAGDWAGVASNRSATTSGLAQDMRGLLVSGVTYWASAWVRVDQASTATSTISLNMKEDYAGSSVKYTTIRSTTLIGNQWQRISGIFRYKPTGAEEQMTFYLIGPAATYAIYADEVQFLPPMAYTPPAQSSTTDVVRAQGTNLIVGHPATTINLRGVNVTAYSDTDSDPVEDQMWQARWDYERIAETGMNVVRLNMWQKFWDDYTQPFTGYKQEGWEWLERQIVWAKENHLYLLLDMHAPAGGYQGPNYATKTQFWGTSATAVTNRWRLTQFWVALAERYQHEPTIAGYDFINEPCPQNDAQWRTYALELVDAVRAVDTNHLIDVEISFADDNAPFVLPRTNLMYDFHHYDPWRFSYQLHHISGYGDQGVWGETNMPAIGWDYTAGAVTNFSMAPSGSFDWTCFTSDFVTVTATNAIALEPVLISLSSGGTVTFDEFTIHEYDPSGEFVRECMIVNPETAPANRYLVDPVYPLPSYNSDWIKAGAGTFSTTTNHPHMGARAFTLSGIATVSNNKLMFPVRKDYKYRVAAWIRGTNLTAAGSGIGFRHYTRPEWEMNTWARRDFLEIALREYGWDFWASHDVPVNMGEFGISQMAIKLNRGGLVWLDDTLNLADQYNVNWDYYVYKSSIYGMYVNVLGAGGKPDYCNTGLVSYFTDRLKTDLESQTILFGSLTNKTYGDPPFELTATASSGLSVSFAVTRGPATISSNTVTLTGAGDVTITASQSGDTNYLAAASVDQSFTVAQAAQTITFDSLVNKTYGDPSFELTATASSELSVSFAVTRGPATISSNTATLTGAGSVTITASQSGDTNYLSAASVSQPFMVAQSAQTITFGSLTNKTYGDAPFEVNASASSGLPVSFAVASGPATVSSNTVTLTGAGDVTITASQSGDTNYLAATSVDRTFMVGYRVTLHSGAYGTIVQADSGSNYVVTVTNGAAFPTVTVTPREGSTFTGWNPPAPATITNHFAATATYALGWWVARGVILTNQVNQDFALANQGQVKWVATKASEEFNARLTNGAGSSITALINSFVNADNYVVEFDDGINPSTIGSGFGLNP